VIIMLVVENAFLTLGQKQVLRGLNLKLKEGRSYGMLGHNGAGKSSIAYLLQGLENYHLSQGRIIFNNEDITELSLSERAKRGITLAWQEPARYEGLTVKDFLTLGGRYDKVKAGKFLEFVGLEAGRYLDREIDQSLSGGERKRIEMASVMMIEPRVVILDEPDSGIDFQSYQKVLDVITYLKSEGAIVVIITHNVEITDRLDYAYLICNGLAYREGDPEEVREFYLERCNNCPYDEEGSVELEYRAQSGI